MNKVVLLALVGSLALLTESCSFFSDFAKARKELEKETVRPIPVKVNTGQNKPQSTEEEAFADLEEEEPVQVIGGLIPATNPDVRVKNSVRGRNDPFSVVTLNPSIEIEKREEKQVNNSRANRGNQTSRAQNGTDSDRSNSASLPDAPPIEPTLAKEVVISGLFEANGRTKLIVQAPEESSSRYVEVGQYLSNGQVLVKSIEKDHFPSPKVILEQAGVEVDKTIGENLSEKDRVGSLPLNTYQNQT